MLLGDPSQLLVHANLLFLEFLVEEFLPSLFDAPVDGATEKGRAEAGASRNYYRHYPVILIGETEILLDLPFNISNAVLHGLREIAWLLIDHFLRLFPLVGVPDRFRNPDKADFCVIHVVNRVVSS